MRKSLTARAQGIQRMKGEHVLYIKLCIIGKLVVVNIQKI